MVPLNSKEKILLTCLVAKQEFRCSKTPWILGLNESNISTQQLNKCLWFMLINLYTLSAKTPDQNFALLLRRSMLQQSKGSFTSLNALNNDSQVEMLTGERHVVCVKNVLPSNRLVPVSVSREGFRQRFNWMNHICWLMRPHCSLQYQTKDGGHSRHIPLDYFEHGLFFLEA